MHPVTARSESRPRPVGALQDQGWGAGTYSTIAAPTGARGTGARRYRPLPLQSQFRIHATVARFRGSVSRTSRRDTLAACGSPHNGRGFVSADGPQAVVAMVYTELAAPVEGELRREPIADADAPCPRCDGRRWLLVERGAEPH